MRSKKYLDEAVKIGEQLLSQVQHDSSGSYWETMELAADDTIVFRPSISIYGGVAGVCVFLLELYKHTAEKQFLQTAQAGIKWCVQKINNTIQNPSFITGDFGVVYPLLQLYEITKNKQYLDQLLEVTRTLPTPTRTTTPLAEYLNGAAGTVVGLLHVHAVTQDAQVLEKITEYVTYIISQTQFGEKGLYWDRNSAQVRGLCGFSHGASGVGFAFLQISRYFQQKEYIWLAEQAFAYENYYFTERTNNWPDFRVTLFSHDDIAHAMQNFEQGNTAKLTAVGDMNAWCHGAAGIGLARIAALSTTGTQTYQADLEKALSRTAADFTQRFINVSHSLCHGWAGNAEIFLTAYSATNQNLYYKQAQQYADALIEYHAKTKRYISGYGHYSDKENASLFMGSAGVGYFYLRMFKPTSVPSILAPELVGKTTAKLPEFDRKQLQKTPLIKRIVAVEKRVQSSALLFIQEKVNAARVREIEFVKLESIPQLFALSSAVELYTENQEFNLLLVKPTTAQSLHVSEFCYSVLSEFKKPKTAQQAVKSWYKKHASFAKTVAQEQLESAFLQQIAQAARANILLVQ